LASKVAVQLALHCFALRAGRMVGYELSGVVDRGAVEFRSTHATAGLLITRDDETEIGRQRHGDPCAVAEPEADPMMRPRCGHLAGFASATPHMDTTLPARVRPELVAHGPSEVWSWDITALKGPACGDQSAGDIAGENSLRSIPQRPVREQPRRPTMPAINRNGRVTLHLVPVSHLVR
jgi:hypothetical protein